MSLKVRSTLVLVIGTVLGLAVSVSSSMLADHQARRSAAGFRTIEDQGLALIAEAIDRVRSEYVDRVDDQTLVENAIRGILEGLDQHSRFLDNDQYEDIRIVTTGNYSGVGLQVEQRDGRLVVEPMADTPAAAAGILAGDVVVSVDDIPVDARDIEATVSRMRGEPGTQVKLDVDRDGEARLSFSLTRAAIHENTVRSEYLGAGIGYLRLTGFSDSTLSELDAAAAGIMDGGVRELSGLVLDLRDNPGGVLEAAIGVADRFLDDGLIVRGTGRIRQARFEQYAAPGDALEQVPLAVLINRGSASASEIVAGAIRDHRRAPLIGQRSYGKGSVQSVVPLGAGSAMKLTTAHFVTPSGFQINGRGIEPTVIVYNDDPREQYRGAGSTIAVTEDNQLQRALESLGYESIALNHTQ